MVDRLWRTQIVIPMLTGIGRDTCVNDMWYKTDGSASEEDDADSVLDHLQTFYTVAGTGGTNSISHWLASQISLDDSVAKTYLMSDPEPRTPRLTRQPFLDEKGTDTLVHQVAGVLSFQKVPTSGEIAARQRGRIYIGPLRLSAVDTTGMLNSTFISDCVAAAGSLLAVSGAAGREWVVFSRASGNVAFTVDRAYMDNGPDIQRRRKVRSTTRFTAPPLP